MIPLLVQWTKLNLTELVPDMPPLCGQGDKSLKPRICKEIGKDLTLRGSTEKITPTKYKTNFTQRSIRKNSSQSSPSSSSVYII